MKMEVTVHVPDRQTIQEPTIKNGSLEESERDPNLEVNKNSENNSIDNGSVENNLKTASKCDGQQSKMELHVTSAEVKSDLAVDYKTQNGPTFEGNSSEQMDKCAVANEVKQTQNNSENVGSLKKNNGNVAVSVTSSSFMSSIDAVIHSVAHNVPDEPNELEQNSASSKVSDPHFIQEYNHPPHASFNHVKQMNLPQSAVGERTFNPAFPQHIYQHGYPNPQALTSSVSNAIHGKPSTSQAHHPSASEQLSSLVKTHVLESGSDQKISNSQSNLGLPPGQVAQTQPNIPVTLFYNNPSMSNRQMLDPNTGLPIKPPTADENTLSHVQRQALNSHSQLQNEIPNVNQSRSEGNKSRAPPKSGARRPPRPSQARNQDMMRPRMMPEHMNRAMRPMMDPRMMNYFTPENIRMLQQRFPDPRMMPPQLLQHMQQFARMHQAAQQQQQQAHSQHPQIAHAPGNPVMGPQQAHSQPSQTPQNLTQPLHASHPNSGEGQAPQIAHSGNIHQGILNRPPLHMLPQHLQPMPHGNMPQPTASLHNNQVHHSQAQVSQIPHGRPTECESGPLTTGPVLSSDIHNSTALASSSAPHLPTGEGLSRPPSAGGLNRPSSVGAANRPPSVGRPPSAGRPASVGRTSASGSRPPSVGRPTSAEPPPNRPPSVNRTPPASNRPPSADPLSRPSSANQPTSISQPEVAKTPPVTSIHQMPSGIQEPIMSTNIEKSMPSTSSIPSSTQTDSMVNMNSSIPSSSSQTSQSQMMTSAITQTPYADETSEEPPGDSSSQKNTSGQPGGNATTAPSSQPNMPPPFMHSTSVAPMPTGYVQTPFGMLPHHATMMTQAGGVPYSGVNGPRMMPPRMQIPANMRMPGFPPGFPMPSHMQRMPPHHGTQLSPNSMQAMASLAQQMQVPVSGQSVRPGMPNQSVMGPRGMNPGMPPSSMPTPPFDMFRMSFPMGAQQHPHRQSNMPAGESIPRGPRPKGPRQQRPMAPLQTSPCAEEGLNSPGLSMAGMMPNQLGNQPPDVPGQPIHSQPRPPSIGIASLPSSSPIDSATPSPKIPPTPPGGIDPAALAEMMRTTQVKQEPNDSTCKTGLSQEEIDQRNNLLLKKLLAAKNAAKVNQQMSGMSEVGVPKKESDDSVQLTAEQQKQLELIEKMPYVMESEMSTEDWDSKTPEERENILELKKQAYEQKRKEFENLRKQKRKQAAAENKKRKRKEKEAIEGQMLVDPTQQPPPPKKRQRKKKQPESLEEDREAKAEHFLQMLRTLPQVLLQEPKVGNFFNVTPVPGSPMVITGEKCLKGSFGKSYLEGVADFYGNTLLQGLPPLGSFVRLPGPRDIESRRKFLGVGKDETPPEQQRYQLVQDRFPLPPQTQQPFHLPGLSPILGRGDKPADPALPPPPRIEPKLDMMYRGSDSPCTVISSSSPEHEFGDFEDENFPMLKPIDPPTSSEDRLSPLVPILQPIAVKTQEVAVKENQTEIKSDPEAISKPVIDQDLAEKKLKSLTEKENVNGKMPPNLSALTRPFRDANLNQDISVTLTLSANAAEDIGGVLSQIAELLKIAVPPSYEVSRSPSPEQFKMNMKHREEPVNIHSLIKSKAKFCRLCDSVVYDSGFRKKKCDIPFLAKEDYISFKDFDDEEVTFCGEKCYTQFATIYQEIKKPPPELREDYSAKTYFGLSTPKMHMMSDMISPRSMGTLTPTTPTKSDSTLTLTPSTPNSAGALTPVQPSPPIKSRLDDKLAKKHRRTDSIDSVPKPMKKWKNIRYKRWDASFTASLPHAPGVPEKEIQNLWKVLGTIIVPKPLPEDTRKCCFCQQYGDGETDGPGRLLNLDIDKYVHLNCALWSSEVYETLNGALMNVDGAYTRGLTIECANCKVKGATVGCFNMRCPRYYHLGCAKKVGCMFFQNKTIFCPSHALKQGAEKVLESLSVFRRVYINRNEDKQVANMVHGQEEGHHILRIGSLILHNVGQLLPHQIQTCKFHTRDHIYPVGFKSSRYYWSMKTLYKRCSYVCSIIDNDGRPGFVIRVVEPGREDIVIQDDSPRAVWKKILEPLDKLRRNADLVKIFPTFTSGEELFGLTEPAIVRVLESLPGTDLLSNYNFKNSRSLRIEMPLTINPTGCARTEPKLRTHFRKPHTLQSSNTSRSLPQTVMGFTGDINSPYMKQFVHSKSQQYRRLKTEWKLNVYLGRSRIQGLGLFAARDLEKHTMVIEYIGDLIRNEVANRKEIIYEEQNRGVYMFRIDNDTVVDATMAGGPARYINHSCNPNCVAEVVPFDKESKIIIITNRRIPTGEELTYDYKFDFEDEQHKIPCCCGASGCRKWMN